MNEGYRYIPEEYDIVDDGMIDASKVEILEKLAGADHISVMELMSLSRHNYDTIANALQQLESSGQIRKTFDVTFHQNVLIGYELVKK